MRRMEVASAAAVVVLTVATLSAQTQTAATKSAQPSAPSGERVTVTGCVERSDQVNSTGTSLATSVDSLSFVLIKAADGPAASAPANPPTASGTSGSTFGPMYRLQADTNKLNPHVGHKVEIVGTREAPEPSSVAAQAANAANPSAATAPALRVESVKMISPSCAR